MGKAYVLNAEKRERAGKGIARAIRREGKVPAVIYGDKKETVSISLPGNELIREYKRGHMWTSLCDMKVGGESYKVLARDIQFHPVNDQILHVDFLRVTNKTKLTVSIPVHFLNEEESPGMKDGGVLNIVRHEIDLVCSAMNIPDNIEVDIGALEIGDSIHVSDITLPEGTHPSDEHEFTIAGVVAPRAVVEEDEEEAEGEDAEGEEGEAAEGEKGEESEGESEEKAEE